MHYHFVEKADMEAAIERGEFIEYARVHSNMYGTSVRAVEDVTAAGKTCLLDIDVQARRTLRPRLATSGKEPRLRVGWVDGSRLCVSAAQGAELSSGRSVKPRRLYKHTKIKLKS